jgi:hypothetical protein
MLRAMQDNEQPFRNPAAVASYAEDTPRNVPGLADLHRMAILLLSEHATEIAHILVVGARRRTGNEGYGRGTASLELFTLRAFCGRWA